jgi:hypothetical protein
MNILYIIFATCVLYLVSISIYTYVKLASCAGHRFWILACSPPRKIKHASPYGAKCYHPKLHVDGLAVELPKMNKLLFKFRVQKSSQAPWSLVHSSNFRISITNGGIVIDELV